MKFALIGNGNIAPQYIQAFQDLSTDFIVCSRSKPHNFPYPHTTDFMSPEVLSCDYICIATPPHLHYEMANYYLNLGKRVILEKPGVTTADELEVLKNHPQRGNLYLAYHSAFNPLIEKVLSTFPIHDLTEVEVNYAEDVFFYHPDKSGWLFNKHLSGGGCLADSGINILSILYRFLPKLTFVEGELVKRQLEVEDALNLTMTTKSGIRVKITMDWLSNTEERKFTFRGRDKLVFDLATNKVYLNGDEVDSKNETERVDQYAEYRNMLADALQFFENKSRLIFQPALPLSSVLDIYRQIKTKVHQKEEPAHLLGIESFLSFATAE